jgi:hypothetical protein
MKAVASQYDQQYWEHAHEKSHQMELCEALTANAKKSDKSTNSGNPHNNPAKSSSSNNNNQQSLRNPNNKPPANNPLSLSNTSQTNKSAGSSSTSSSTPTAKQYKKPNLMDKVGKDGKLTPEECKHHLNSNLCLFCRTFGHKVTECRKREATNTANNNKPKARKADATILQPANKGSEK